MIDKIDDLIKQTALQLTVDDKQRDELCNLIDELNKLHKEYKELENKIFSVMRRNKELQANYIYPVTHILAKQAHNFPYDSSLDINYLCEVTKLDKQLVKFILNSLPNVNKISGRDSYYINLQ